MTPSKKHIIYEAAAAPKGKEKSIEAPEHADRQPDPSDVHISNADHISNDEDLTQTPHRREGGMPLKPSPRSTASSSFRCFPLCGIWWETANGDDLTLRVSCSWKRRSDLCLGTISQTVYPFFIFPLIFWEFFQIHSNTFSQLIV